VMLCAGGADLVHQVLLDPRPAAGTKFLPRPAGARAGDRRRR